MVLTLGTDCSGIEAPACALRRLKVPFRHRFASECNRTARRWLRQQQHCPPELLYEDVCTRGVAPRVDLYVAGPPCVQFSGMNQRTLDRQSPACAAFEAVVAYIERRKPRAAVLENVPRLTSKGKPLFDDAVARIAAAGYETVEWRVLDPQQFNVPQSRPRLFIVCLWRGGFEWPAPVPLRRTLFDGLCTPAVPTPPPPAIRRLIDGWGLDPSLEGVYDPNAYGYQLRGRGVPSCPVRRVATPALVAKQPGLYVHHEGRMLTGKEALWFQGFDAPPPPGLSDQQVKRLAGNAMQVDTLAHLLAKVLTALGRPTAPPPPLKKNV